MHTVHAQNGVRDKGNVGWVTRLWAVPNMSIDVWLSSLAGLGTLSHTQHTQYTQHCHPQNTPSSARQHAPGEPRAGRRQRHGRSQRRARMRPERVSGPPASAAALLPAVAALHPPRPGGCVQVVRKMMPATQHCAGRPPQVCQTAYPPPPCAHPSLPHLRNAQRSLCRSSGAVVVRRRGNLEARRQDGWQVARESRACGSGRVYAD